MADDFAPYLTEDAEVLRQDAPLVYPNALVPPPLLFWRCKCPSFFIRLELQPMCSSHLFPFYDFSGSIILSFVSPLFSSERIHMMP